MVIYDLKCSLEHRFEGWFRSIADYEKQLEDSLLTCPVCGDRGILKLPTASRLNLSHDSGNHKDKTSTQSPVMTENQHVMQMLNQLHSYVKQNFDNVGDRFCEEAKMIHYGESEKRNIVGQATVHQYQELVEEGIEVSPLPPVPIEKEKLN